VCVYGDVANVYEDVADGKNVFFMGWQVDQGVFF